MRIVIDMQGAQCTSRFRGIGRYSLSLAKAIARNRKSHEIILVLNGLFPDSVEPIRAEFNDLIPQENIRVWYSVGPVHSHDPSNKTRRNLSERLREAFIEGLTPDILLNTSIIEGFGDNAVSSVRTIDTSYIVSSIFYDAIPIVNPDSYLNPNPAFKKLYLEKIDHIKKSDILLSISESSRKEAIEYINFPEDQIFNISSATTNDFYKKEIKRDEEDALRRKFNITKKFLMYSGATDDRKNHIGLISAFAALPERLRQEYQLVIVGGMPDDHKKRFENHVENLKLTRGDVIFTGRVNDDELVSLYNLCYLFVFPSLHEGFGLPILEALSCGAAVIGSNNTSVPEVIGAEEALFDPTSVASISEAIFQALTDRRFYTYLKERGPTQAEKFSWDISAVRALEIFECACIDNQPSSKPKIDARSWAIEQAVQLSGGLTESERLLTAQAISRNHPPQDDTKRLFLDISTIFREDLKTGVQRVVRNLLKEIILSPPNGYQVDLVYSDIDSNYRYANSFKEHFCDIAASESNDSIHASPGDVFFGLDLSPPNVITHRDFYQGLRRHGVRVEFMVYDLLAITMSGYFQQDVVSSFEKWFEVISECDGVICISEAVASDVSRYIEKMHRGTRRPFRVSWAHLGADMENSAPSFGLPDDADELLAKLAQKPTFAMVSTIEPRKGYAQALAAFEELWARGSDVNLVIVGKQGWNVDALVHKLRTHPELNSRLFWLEGISDEYLEKIYGAASCLIAASEGEGFGLPLIEAARHKLPILARDIPVFREVAGAHAAYFDGSTPAALANAVQNWLSAYQNGQHTRSDDMPWITWKESAEQMMTALLDRSDAQSPLHSDDLPRERSISLSA